LSQLFNLVQQELDLYTVNWKTQSCHPIRYSFKTSTNLNRFSKFFYCWTQHSAYNKSPVILCTTP